MAKTDKELAVELACAALNAMGTMRSNSLKPLSGNDIQNILTTCYNSIRSLDTSDGK